MFLETEKRLILGNLWEKSQRLWLILCLHPESRMRRSKDSGKDPKDLPTGLPAQGTTSFGSDFSESLKYIVDSTLYCGFCLELVQHLFGGRVNP